MRNIMRRSYKTWNLSNVDRTEREREIIQVRSKAFMPECLEVRGSDLGDKNEEFKHIMNFRFY